MAGPSIEIFPTEKPSVSARLHSSRMRAVRQEDTAPELAVRRFLHAAGFRYSLHGQKLPGRPDIVLAGRKSVVFVNGCFWHGHDCAHGRVASKTNTAFWQQKIDANRRRDDRKATELTALGWHVEVVWECEVTNGPALFSLASRLRLRAPAA
jgi:DNA mismatch endonuclease (patch repair protein)